MIVSKKERPFVFVAVAVIGWLGYELYQARAQIAASNAVGAGLSALGSAATGIANSLGLGNNSSDAS